jgi:hypothetical protein
MKTKLAYVKDGGFNFNNMIIVLKLVVNYKALGIEENYQGACFGHAFFKTC